MMKILFDLTAEENCRNRGIGNYLLGMARELARRDDVVLAVVISATQTLPPLEAKVYRYGIDEIVESFDWFLCGALFQECSHDWYRTKVYKTSQHTAGIIYDFIPGIFAKDYINNEISRASYAEWLASVNLLDHLFVISKSTATDALSFTNFNESSITTIYAGINRTLFFPGISLHDRKKELVAIVGDDPRKNTLGAVRGFCEACKEKLIDEKYRFIITCRCSENFRSQVNKIAEQYGLNDRIEVTGFVSDGDLSTRVREATATIFPSFYEGFGLPILESLACGTPCVSSNLSSCTELNISSCQFDPYSTEDIKRAIIEILNDSSLQQKCISFSECILKECRWSVVVDKTLCAMKGKTEKSEKIDKIALFSTLPPDESGVAVYTKKLIDAAGEDVHAFASDHTYLEAVKQRLNTDNIYPICAFSELERHFNYTNKIFVIGNSEHSIPVIDAAIKWGKTTDWLYIHDGNISGLIRVWCVSKKLAFDNVLEKNDLTGVATLNRLTRIQKIFYNTEKAGDLFSSIFKKEGRTIILKKLFLPIELKQTNNDRNSDKKKDSGCPENSSLRIGTFGIADDLNKGTSYIIKSIEKLNKEGFPCKLIMAGYNMKEYWNKKRIPSYVEVYTHVNDEQLQSLIDSVEIGVQLRPHFNGEASGCVSQLLAHNKKVVTTRGFVDSVIAQYVYEVSAKVDTIEIAQIIKDITKNSKGRIFPFEDFSFHKLWKTIAENVAESKLKNNQKYSLNHDKKIFFDVSVTHKNTFNGGIQRTVKNLGRELSKSLPKGYTIEFIAFDCIEGCFKRISDDFIENCEQLMKERVNAQEGDIVLLFDLNDSYASRCGRKYLSEIRRRGVKVISLVYDLVYVFHPNLMANEHAAQTLRQWLESTIECSDVLLTNTETVKKELMTFMDEKKSPPVPVRSFQLGSNIDKLNVVENLRERDSIYEPFKFLSVSTLEPRKGYEDLIKGFLCYLNEARDQTTELHIVGRKGWKYQQIVELAEKSNVYNKQLYLHTNITDEQLVSLYKRADTVIAASYYEGFGLSVVEATSYRKPLLLRDILVFRELAGGNAIYFAEDASDLSKKIGYCVKNRNTLKKSDNIKILTWQESASLLINLLKPWM